MTGPAVEPGPGTFQNPVIPGFHPDPSVCRVGDDYYLATSSFEWWPGLPIFHSRDLVHWRHIANALDRPSQLSFPADLGASRGIWAPTIRHHDGRFWIATTAVDMGGVMVLRAVAPDGPWSDPVWLDLPGIDPDLVWDDTGACWCATSGITVARIDPAAGRVLETSVPVWPGTGMAYPEAPHLYRIGDWWYLLIAEGGTEKGHAVSVARGRSPRGPFESGPANPILSHRSTDHPIQSTGHGDLVQGPDGGWWMVFLATRPRGAGQRFHVLGRETFLAPVTWADGWPVIGPVEERMVAPRARAPWPAPPARDDFDAPQLGLGYVSPRGRAPGSWSLDARPGWLTLTATGDSLDRPMCTFVGKRQAALAWRVAARLDPGTATGGLSVRYDEAHHYDLEVADGVVAVIARIGPVRQRIAERAVSPGPLTHRVAVRTVDRRPSKALRPDEPGPDGSARATGPDTIAFWVEDMDGPIAELDGRYVSTEVATGFTGRVIGMYVIAGTASLDWYEAHASP
jgi:beta-xylosidase